MKYKGHKSKGTEEAISKLELTDSVDSVLC